MDRRSFLRTSFATTVGLSLSRSGLASVAPAPLKIVIVGSGLSGLVAGYELSKLRYDVTILEAQDRIGGRVITLRSFDDGLYADAGAARIPKDHDKTHKYVREFELPLIPFYPDDGSFQRMDKGVARRVDWQGFVEATNAVIGLEKPDHWQKIKGGNDLLPHAFAKSLGDKIRLRSIVREVTDSSTGVTIRFEDNGTLREIRADKVIVAVPLTTLRNIAIPSIPEAKRGTIQKAGYDSASRVFLQTRDRYWLRSDLNGFAFGGQFNEVWNSTFGQPGSRGIIQDYTRYVVSGLVTGMPPEARLTNAIKNLTPLFPDLQTHFEKGFSKCWSEDPWVKGAWGTLSPKDKATLAESLNGRIYFAGEHLSNHGSWMQGALESGLAVVDQVSRSAVAARG